MRRFVLGCVVVLGGCGETAPKPQPARPDDVATPPAAEPAPTADPTPSSEPEPPPAKVDDLKLAASPPEEPCRKLEAYVDGEGKPTEVPRITTYAYDPTGRLAHEAWGYSSDVDERDINIQERKRYVYNDSGRLDRIEHRVGDRRDPAKIERFEYDERGNVTRHVYEDAKSGETTFVITRRWDDEDRVILEERDTDGDGNADEITRTKYPAAGRKVWTREKDGKAREWSEVEESPTLTVTRSGDFVSREEDELDNDGKVTRSTDTTTADNYANTTRTVYEYDDKGRRVRELYDGGGSIVAIHMTEWTYDCDGEP